MIINELDGAYKPSALTAYERFEALVPILSEASEAYLRVYCEKQCEQRDTEIATRLNSLFDKVSKNSAMSVEEVRRSFLGYTLKGFSGLMTPTPIDAKQCVQDARGTWELAARYTNGGNSANCRPDDRRTLARSKIYYEATSPTEMTELVTMWNDENHYPREDSLSKHACGPDDTFFIVALSKSKFRQVDEFTVEYTNTSELVGNHGHYLKPIRGDGRVLLMKVDGELTFASIPDGAAIMDDGTRVAVTGTYLLLNNRISPTSRTFTMSGLPPMHGDTRSMDVTDSYVKVSDQQPLIGGWEPISAYYARLRDPENYSQQLVTQIGKNGHVHGFFAGNRDTLRTYA